MALIHSVVCYASPPKTALAQFRGPAAPPPSPLLAHLYGVKNMYTGLIRAYAAYYIQNEQVYDLAIFTFAAVLFLYITEYAVWKTAGLREALFPFVLAGTALTWMVTQRSFYV